MPHNYYCSPTEILPSVIILRPFVEHIQTVVFFEARPPADAPRSCTNCSRLAYKRVPSRSALVASSSGLFSSSSFFHWVTYCGLTNYFLRNLRQLLLPADCPATTLDSGC